MLSDHVGLHTSSRQGGTQRDEGARSGHKSVQGKTESQGTNVAEESGEISGAEAIREWNSECCEVGKAEAERVRLSKVGNERRERLRKCNIGE